MASQNIDVRIEADGSGFGVVTVNGQRAGWARAVGSGDNRHMRLTIDVALGNLTNVLAHFDNRSKMWVMPDGSTFATEYQRGEGHMPRIMAETRSSAVTTREATPNVHRFKAGTRRGVCAVCNGGTRAAVHREAHDTPAAQVTPAAAPVIDADMLAAALRKALGL